MVDNTIALQVQTPNIMNTMSNMASTAGAMQQAKQGQMDLQERQALRGLAQNLNNYKMPDGNLDLNKLVNDATQAAPKLGMQWAGQIAQAHSEGIAVDKALSEVSEQQRGIMGQVIESVANKPFDVQQKVINSVVQANPRLGVWGQVGLKHLKSSWDAGGPEAAQQTAMQIAKGTVGVATQNTLNTPNLVPSADRNNNPVYRDINPMNQNNVPAGAIGNGGTPEFIPSGPKLGAVQNIEDMRQQVSAIRQAGDQVPIQRNTNQQILKLSQDTKTGPGSQYWQKGMAALGLPSGTNYQELGKYLEKNAIQAMQTMGAPSDARLSAAVAANGSTEFNPGALQAVTKFNDAAVSGLEAYRQGMDKAVGVDNPNFGAAAKYKADWAKNFDVDVFRVENALRDKDAAELKKIAGDLGPEKMKKLAAKIKNLDALRDNGSIQ